MSDYDEWGRKMRVLRAWWRRARGLCAHNAVGYIILPNAQRAWRCDECGDLVTKPHDPYPWEVDT